MTQTAPSVRELIVSENGTLRSALQVLDQTGSGFLMAINASGKLVGVLTDGDIRRALLRSVPIDGLVADAMQVQYTALSVDAEPVVINAALDDKIAFVPLVDAEGCPADYASTNRHRRYPVMEPVLDGNEMEYVQECIRTGWISSQGRFVGLFESMMAEFHGMPYALAVSNGTVALHLALLGLKIGPGDEVIVPDLTFAATANAVLYSGATPVFVDVRPDSWNMDPAQVEAAITPRTRAVMPVHLYGNPCDMDALCAIARRHQLKLIEDAAESFGATWKGTLTGAFGDSACFSFFGNKTLTTGEGGIVLFRDAVAFERARMLRDHGMSKQRRYWHLEVGYNYRLTNLQAAVGVAQLERAEDILARKRAVARRYRELLADVPGIELPPAQGDCEPIYWLFTIMVVAAGITRDELAERLLRNGIETRPVFFPMHGMPPYRPYCKDRDFPVADLLSANGLSLPSAVTLSDADIENVVANIKAILSVRKMAGTPRVAVGS
jgi:perosamine synthetase